MIKNQKKIKFIHKTFPLIFWKHCRSCKRDFLWEWGWWTTNDTEGWRWFVCCRCAPTFEIAEKVIYEVPRKPWLNAIRSVEGIPGS